MLSADLSDVTCLPFSMDQNSWQGCDSGRCDHVTLDHLSSLAVEERLGAERSQVTE